MTKFQINDPSLESQWRSIILFGKNSATYKFAFAKSLLELMDKEVSVVKVDFTMNTVVENEIYNYLTMS